jgi:hypothetical protein
MSSTHEPPQLLEPSNLLEPLDLKHQHGDFADPSACGERGERGPRTQTQFTRGKPRIPRPRQAERRSSMKSILLAAGALACFGAGTLFSHMQIVTPSDVGSPTMATANRSFAPLADVATKSDESISTEGKSANSSANESKPDAASSTAATIPPATMPPATTPAEQNGSAPAQRAQGGSVAQPPANNAVAGCAGSCKQQPCSPDDANCLEGGAPSPAKDLTNADGSAATPAPATRPSRQRASVQSTDSERADNRADSRADSERAGTRTEERAQSSRRSKRAAQREAADQPPGSKRKVATGSATGRRQEGNRASVWRRDVASDDGMPWQSRNADQASNEWRDWTADKNLPTARFSGRAENVDQAVNWHRDRAGENRWQEREPDRASNSRRDREDRWQERDWDRASTRRRERSDEYGRDDDRRLRAGRDDFLMGRAERNEGSFMIVPPARYRW